MELRNFVLHDRGPERAAGECQVGGRAAHAIFDRLDRPQARLTVRFDMAPSAPLPAFARDRTKLTVAGTAVPVEVAVLDDGAEALRGPIDLALVETVAGDDAPGMNVAPGAPDPDAADPLVTRSREHAAAKRERRQHAARVAGLRSETADLRAQLEAAEAELATAGETAAAHAERCAELLQQLRDALDAEEA